ncbi:UNVERIFIED_CONTAM: hypothetical protein Slati_2501000 [Sesamum latifolium]|uniref:Uncharacterized protein n=1 Tax=Sesamum latifolium TaxID=2727402 RepID=A0AAW2WFT4_9LAMI
MTGDGSSSWNSSSSLHIPTALDMTTSGIQSPLTMHVTVLIPQVEDRSRGLESYRPSLQGFHMTIPASQFSQL